MKKAPARILTASTSMNPPQAASAKRWDRACQQQRQRQAGESQAGHFGQCIADHRADERIRQSEKKGAGSGPCWSWMAAAAQ